MKFIILTQYFLPETGAPQQRLSDLSRRLKDMGHQVTVLTALPNYPSGQVHSSFQNHICKRVEQDGTPVFHCWLYATRSKRMLLRLLNYFSFVLSAALLGIFVLPRADYLLVESPPIFLGLTARWLSWIKGSKLIFNVSDLYPETAIMLGYLQKPWQQKLMYTFEAWCYSAAYLITGQTEGIVRSIQNRFPHKKVYLFTNGVDLDKFSLPVNKPEINFSDDFIIGYAGILGHAQDLISVLEAAVLLREHKQIKFAFYGDGPLREDLVGFAKYNQLNTVCFMGHISHEEIIPIMKTWDVGIVPLKNTSLMAGALPSKMFEMLASSLPVLIYAPEGEASALVQKAEAGWWVQAGQPDELANVIFNIAKDKPDCNRLGNNGREWVCKYYNRAEIAQNFARALLNS